MTWQNLIGFSATKYKGNIKWEAPRSNKKILFKSRRSRRPIFLFSFASTVFPKWVSIHLPYTGSRKKSCSDVIMWFLTLNLFHCHGSFTWIIFKVGSQIKLGHLNLLNSKFKIWDIAQGFFSAAKKTWVSYGQGQVWTFLEDSVSIGPKTGLN